MKNPIALLCIVGLLFSCTPKQEISSCPSTLIDFDNATTLNFNPHTELADVIALEDAEGGYVGEVSRLFVNDEYIVVFSKGSNNILLFSRSGKFLRKIGSSGSANKEYFGLFDVQYDEKEQKIYAFDGLKHRMFIYNLEGVLERTIDTEYDFEFFAKCERGYWVYTNHVDEEVHPVRYNLVLLDNELNEVLAEYFPSSYVASRNSTPTFTRDKDGMLYFCHSLSASVYQLGDEVTEIFRPDFGERNLPFDRLMKADNSDEVRQIRTERNYVSEARDVVVYNDHLFLRYYDSHLFPSCESYYLFYNRTGHTCTLSSGNSFIQLEGLEGQTYFSPLGVTSRDELIYTFSPHDISYNADYLAYYSELCNRPITKDSNNLVVLLRAKK